MWYFLYYAAALQLGGVLALALADKAVPQRRRGLRLLAAAALVASTVTLVTGSALTITSGQHQATDAILITLMAIIGTIVNVSSNATRGIHRVPYSAAKGGVNAITQSLAMEMAGRNIRVDIVDTDRSR